MSMIILTVSIALLGLSIIFCKLAYQRYKAGGRIEQMRMQAEIGSVEYPVIHSLYVAKDLNGFVSDKQVSSRFLNNQFR